MPPSDVRSDLEEENLPVTISEEPIADEEEVGNGPFNINVPTNDEEKFRATIIIQAHLRGIIARSNVLQMKANAVIKKVDIGNSTNTLDPSATLELDDDYKDDAFDSADGKSEEIHSLEVVRLISGVDQSIKTENNTLASAHII